MIGLFATGPTSIVFYVVYSLWWLTEVIGALLIPALRRRGKNQVRRDQGSAMLIVSSIFIAIFVAFGFGYTSTGQLPDWVFYPGIFLMLLGIVIRQYAIAVLGRFFSLTVRVAEDHKVVDRGPYKLVRHPSYTGVLLTFLGLGLAVQSWAAILTLLVVFTIAYGYRMQVEEKALVSQLGENYLGYMKRTKRLIPYLI
jgi:protein-S-isoprenylcysteine O-methyltransferase Ste14